jgi:hypothetical protein
MRPACGRGRVPGGPLSQRITANRGALIAKLYQVRLTEPGVGKYLKRWGPSFQRPDKRAVEQDLEAVRKWLEETWPTIRAQARTEAAEVLFADQVGIRYSPELNPDELVNADLKRSLSMHNRARDQAQLAAETRRFFYRRQRQPHIIRGYFGGPHLRYILE